MKLVSQWEGENCIFKSMPSRAISLSCYKGNGIIRKNSFINYYTAMNVDQKMDDDVFKKMSGQSSTIKQDAVLLQPNKLFNYLMDSVKSQFKASLKSKQITQKGKEANLRQQRTSLGFYKSGKSHNKIGLEKSVKVQRKELWQNNLSNISKGKKKVILNRAKQTSIKNLDFQTVNDSEIVYQLQKDDFNLDIPTEDNQDYLRSRKYVKSRSEEKKRRERLKSESECTEKFNVGETKYIESLNLHIRSNLFSSKQKKPFSQAVRALSALQIFGTSHLNNKVKQGQVFNKCQSGSVERIQSNNMFKYGYKSNELMIQMPHRQSIHSRKNNIRRNKKSAGYPLCFQNRAVSIKN